MLPRFPRLLDACTLILIKIILRIRVVFHRERNEPMGLPEDLLERASSPAVLGVGLGVLFLGPVLVPAVGRGLRPIAKGAIKGYLALSERTREMFAETGERLQDLYAEAQAEYTGADGSTQPAEETPARKRATRGESPGEAQPEPA